MLAEWQKSIWENGFQIYGFAQIFHNKVIFSHCLNWQYAIVICIHYLFYLLILSINERVVDCPYYFVRGLFVWWVVYLVGQISRFDRKSFNIYVYQKWEVRVVLSVHLFICSVNTDSSPHLSIIVLWSTAAPGELKWQLLVKLSSPAWIRPEIYWINNHGYR